MVKGKSLKELAPNAAQPLGEFVEEYVVKPLFDADGVQCASGIGKDGREYPDPVPAHAPLGVEPPIGLRDLMELFLRRSKEKDNDFEIEENEEEANDFAVEDEDFEVVTEYEKVFMPMPAPAGVSSPVVPPTVQVAAEGGPQPTGAPPKPPESVPKVT